MTATTLDARAVYSDWMARHIGEDPPHSNCNEITHWYGFCGAWCCMGCSKMLNDIGLPVFHEAAVVSAMNDAIAGKDGLVWIARDGIIREGDMSCFDWTGHRNPNDMHISYVRDPLSQSQFQTIGCNENDTVMIQTRDRTYVMGFIRPPYINQPQEPWDMPDTAARIDAIYEWLFVAGKAGVANMTGANLIVESWQRDKNIEQGEGTEATVLKAIQDAMTAGAGSGGGPSAQQLKDAVLAALRQGTG